MLENVRIGMDESTFKIKADESINRMLGCLLNESAKTCKSCRQYLPIEINLRKNIIPSADTS
ncbi:MAG: hypothetical protein AMK70_16125 [Nitrospira bacterium SG8_35_1]|nr:MAG: hypothetical protein AMK70_16125 [Nitrospira bacterium SG8_35_1]